MTNRVLMITGGFPPAKKYGGPPVSIENICTLLDDKLDFYVLALNHDFKEKKVLDGIHSGWNKRGHINVQYLSEKEYKSSNIVSVIDELQPNMLYVNSIFYAAVVLPALCAALKRGVRTIIAPRGEFSPKVYKKKYKKIPYLCIFRSLFVNQNVKYQATFPEEMEYICNALRVMPDRVVYLPNVPSIPSHVIHHRKKEKGKLRVIFVSRILKNKNLLFAILALKEVNANVCFDIYGPIEDNEYWEECLEAIKQLPENIVCKYCGLAERAQIHDLFGDHDVFLFPTYSENYGQAIAESLVSGCPVMTSLDTPWTDMNESNVGWALDIWDGNESFVQELNRIAAMGEEEMVVLRESLAQYVNNKMDTAGLKDKYYQLFTER